MSGEHDWCLRMMAINLMPKLPVDHASAMAVLDRLRELVEWRGQCTPTPGGVLRLVVDDGGGRIPSRNGHDDLHDGPPAA